MDFQSTAYRHPAPPVRRAHWWAVAALLVLGCGATAPAASAAPPLVIERYLAELQALEARFEQQLYDAQGRLIETSSGHFYLQRPNRMRWEYTTPYQQQIISDGSRVWIYDADLEQVTVRSLTHSLDYTPAAILLSKRPLSETFMIRKRPPTPGLEWIELIPHSEEASFATIRIGFDGQQLRQMALADRIGQLTHLKFTELNHNPVLDAALFVFDPPPGVDVFIDGAQ